MNAVSDIRAIQDHVLVAEMKFDRLITKGGIILPTDNGKDEGIRPRWGQVYSVGPKQKDVEVGQWILVSHGRWTRGFELLQGDQKITVRRVDVKDILLVSDEQPADHDL